MVIAQGFSHHATNNAEAIRYRLVTHEGGRTLKVTVQDMSLDSLHRGVAEFSSQSK